MQYGFRDRHSSFVYRDVDRNARPWRFEVINDDPDGSCRLAMHSPELRTLSRVDRRIEKKLVPRNRSSLRHGAHPVNDNFDLDLPARTIPPCVEGVSGLRQADRSTVYNARRATSGRLCTYHDH